MVIRTLTIPSHLRNRTLLKINLQNSHSRAYFVLVHENEVTIDGSACAVGACSWTIRWYSSERVSSRRTIPVGNRSSPHRGTHSLSHAACWCAYALIYQLRVELPLCCPRNAFKSVCLYNSVTVTVACQAHLQKEIDNITIPTISGEKDGFDYSLSNLFCNNFAISSGDVTMSSSSGVGLQLSGLGLSCSLSWSFKLKDWPHIPDGSGTADVTMSGTSASLGVTITDSNGHAQLAPTDVAMKIGSLDISFHGSLWDCKCVDMVLCALPARVPVCLRAYAVVGCRVVGFV